MQNPLVSFIVPCYKLAHFLPECVESILAQTYDNFEILIMDDASPDTTGEAARSFQDSRIKYVRNELNLGHLRNYNKGIGLSRGKYVWLISADDRLRRPYILERYVRLMEKHPTVGYVCCPGIGLQDGVETSLVDCGYYGTRDRIFDGRKFVAASLKRGYGLLAPSVMVRKLCYEKISMFPLDMPHQGDWYLWFTWALEYDVAYLCEPMVNYRSHDLNIMKHFIARSPEIMFRDEVNVLWRTRHACQVKGLQALANKSEDVLAAKYARAAASTIYNDIESQWKVSMAECDQDLRANACMPSDYRRLRSKVAARIANQHWRHGAFGQARRNYAFALHEYWKMPRVWLKIVVLLAGLGRTGLFIRNIVRGT